MPVRGIAGGFGGFGAVVWKAIKDKIQFQDIDGARDLRNSTALLIY
jgi:hypothetical protein